VQEFFFGLDSLLGEVANLVGHVIFYKDWTDLRSWKMDLIYICTNI